MTACVAAGAARESNGGIPLFHFFTTAESVVSATSKLPCRSQGLTAAAPSLCAQNGKQKTPQWLADLLGYEAPEEPEAIKGKTLKDLLPGAAGQ